MAHDKNKIFEETKKIITDKSLFFIEDVVSFLPITKPTFYSYFPIDSNEFLKINKLLGENRVNDCAANRVPEYNNKDGYLYLIHCENSNYYKLGISGISYKNRLSNLQSGCPYKLHLIHAIHTVDYKNI